MQHLDYVLFLLLNLFGTLCVPTVHESYKSVTVRSLSTVDMGHDFFSLQFNKTYVTLNLPCNLHQSLYCGQVVSRYDYVRPRDLLPLVYLQLFIASIFDFDAKPPKEYLLLSIFKHRAFYLYT